MIPKVSPYEVYKTYLSISRHFTTKSYDYHKYCGKVKCSLDSFYKNRQRYWFEKLSRKYSDTEIVELFISNYSVSENTGKIWIGNLVKDGELEYTNWKKRIQSMTYLFRQQTEDLFDGQKVDDVFDCSKGHPTIVKKYLNGDLAIETMVVYDRILGYTKEFDKKLKDPVWDSISSKLRKYSPFLHIDIFKYKKISKEIVLK